jgi:uncharacterized surface anchored protein
MASKRGPLSKAEKFYISEHAKIGKGIDEIAADLDRPLKAIEKCYTCAQKEGARTMVSDQFVREKGCTIMTENASSMSDSKKRVSTQTSRDCVTKVK